MEGDSSQKQVVGINDTHTKEAGDSNQQQVTSSDNQVDELMSDGTSDEVKSRTPSNHDGDAHFRNTQPDRDNNKQNTEGMTAHIMAKVTGGGTGELHAYGDQHMMIVIHSDIKKL